jgi:PAS domain S-box-containing protein
MFYGSIDHSLFIILLFFITAIISYTLLKILFNRTRPIYVIAGICIISLVSWSIHFLLSLVTLHISKKTNDSFILFFVAVLIALCFTTIAFIISHLLKENKQYDRSLFFQHPDMIFLLDINGVFISGNPAVEKNAGYKPSEYIGKHFTQFIVPDQIEKAKKIFERTLKGETCECDLQAWHKNGKIIDIHFKTIPMIRGNHLKGIYVIARNMTELNRFRKELEHLYHKHTLILNSIAEGVCGIDKHKNIVFWNPAAEQMTGYKAEEVIGKTSHAMIHHTKKDGTPYPLDECPIDRAIQDGKTYHISEDIFWKKDGTYFPVSYTVTPISENGVVVGGVLTFTDITELQKTEEFIRTSEKHSVAGQLAAGIAHEIRNPLTAIKGFIQLLQSELDVKKPYLHIIQSEIQRIELILGELLALAKPQAIKFTKRDIGVLLQHVTTLLETQGILHNIQIVTRIDPSLPLIECDENGLKQVFINFLKNAMEAMKNGGRIFIEAQKKDEHSVLIRFIDEGCGIPKEQLEKIGKPFFTTKEKGTGLGMMVSKKIIEDHGGTMSIISEVNKGTTVEVTLPIRVSTSPVLHTSLSSHLHA